MKALKLNEKKPYIKNHEIFLAQYFYEFFLISFLIDQLFTESICVKNNSSALLFSAMIWGGSISIVI